MASARKRSWPPVTANVVYHGVVSGNEREVVAEVDGVFEGLPVRFDLRNHSPDGFAWGYEGIRSRLRTISGSSQLALAILAHATGDDALAESYYQGFKRDVIARLKGDAGFVISRGSVIAWLMAFREHERISITTSQIH